MYLGKTPVCTQSKLEKHFPCGNNPNKINWTFLSVRLPWSSLNVHCALYLSVNLSTWGIYSRTPPPPTYLVSTDRGEPTRKAPPLFRKELSREDLQGRKADKLLGDFFSIERPKSITNRPIEPPVSHLHRSSENGVVPRQTTHWFKRNSQFSPIDPAPCIALSLVGNITETGSLVGCLLEEHFLVRAFHFSSLERSVASHLAHVLWRIFLRTRDGAA